MTTEKKIDASQVYEMQEKVMDAIANIASEVVAKMPTQEQSPMQPQQPQQPIEIDLSAVDELNRQIPTLQEQLSKPQEVKYQHTHTIDIGSSRVFLSLVIMTLIILGLSYVIGNQRRTISQCKENDLKYRYIYMMGEIDGKGITCLERRFLYSDSVRITRKQVEEYERLVREQTESIERARREADKVEKLKEKSKVLKNK
jgi:hypothetical protein